ncbi:hypothetical protein FIBSPDRAFT_542470 [Athelia psychrophila]|uniref:BTB domain-containing protein n=1 Tax=Athelia psychrophila TaxID=1759441 RepID=A0A166J0Q6_9AGAM|nr:hypothetical protein FIBSPDRAFT_542470 [Fibularhizoctonia sp. CBS 109695]
MIPRGKDPIELTNIKPGDFEIMLDFLNLGTRHDKEPLTAVDLASVITVSSIYGMQRVLNLACKTLSDQQNRLDTSRAGAGFDTRTCGLYFLIREKGTVNCLTNYGAMDAEGVQLQLWPLPNIKANTQIFFIDSYGALCHAATGRVVDIVDDVPVLRRRRPVSGLPNPWSRPLAEFSFINSQIRVKFPSNPALPGSTDDLYSDDSWATKQFILAAHTEKDFHMHPISDFAPWIPPVIVGSFDYTTGANHDKKWRALVEERTEDVGGERTSWEIVRASMS